MPEAFRFSVKVPKTITHEQRLRRARAPLQRFLEETEGLGTRRGPLLIQLPPSLAFEAPVAARFFSLLRELYEGNAVCEPRHATWFSGAAERLLIGHRIARVGADPAPADHADVPGGWSDLIYYRLHGSPRMYWSPYEGTRLASLAETLRHVPQEAEVWCIFDNTASGAALENAWLLHESVGAPG